MVVAGGLFSREGQGNAVVGGNFEILAQSRLDAPSVLSERIEQASCREADFPEIVHILQNPRGRPDAEREVVRQRAAGNQVRVKLRYEAPRNRLE